MNYGSDSNTTFPHALLSRPVSMAIFKGFILTQWMDLEWRCKCGLITITPSQKQAVGLGLQVERELPGATWLSGGLAEAPPSLDETLPSSVTLGGKWFLQMPLGTGPLSGTKVRYAISGAWPLSSWDPHVF